MSRTVKFTVSVPGPLFKAIESRRRRAGKSRSEIVREAVQAMASRVEMLSGGTGPGLYVGEDSAHYGTGTPVQEITDAAERRRRAIAAAGRFRSGTSDLSANHDSYLEEAYTAIAGSGAASETGSKRKP